MLHRIKIQITLFILPLLILSIGSPCFGQGKKGVDSSSARNNSGLYKKIEHYSQKSKLMKMIHGWIFRSMNPNTHPNSVPGASAVYSPYEGKIIRHIYIRSMDPFGYSVYDSTKIPDNPLEKLGNAVHVKSKKGAINKFLLIKKNTPLDTMLVHESARLLREQSYIRSVHIIPRPVSSSADSIDIVVKILDSWSLIPGGSFSASQTRVSLQERNFIGFGHRIALDYAKRFSDGKDGYEGFYTVPNIQNTFIDLTGKYAVDYDHYFDKFISVKRDFYSSFTRWAGGIFVQEHSLKRPILDDTLTLANQNIQYAYQDYWAGYAFPVFPGASEEDRTTNLILSLRTYFLKYKKVPLKMYDSVGYFSNERFYLGSIGIDTRQYVRDHYIFRDGLTEDVPVGSIYSLTAGLQQKYGHNRLYLGMRTAYGNYFNWGFLSGNFEAGSFFVGSHPVQTTLSFKANYFSPLLNLGGGWKIRQFIKPQLVLGFNRLESKMDRVGLNEQPYFKGVNSYNYVDYLSKRKYIDYANGNINGFNGPVSGTGKYVLDLQTQTYSPWQFLGFRINPFININLGYITDNTDTFGSNKLYSSFGAGFIIRNDYLVFGSFQFSFSYYPTMPKEGRNIIKTNSFNTGDYGFQNFEMGEPRPVIYE